MFDDALPARVATGLEQIALAMRHQAWTRAARHRLTPTQAQVLRLVAGVRGGLPVRDLAERLALTAQTVSDSVTALHRKDLVTKATDPHDRRVVRITTTKAGARQAAHLAADPDMLATAIGDLTVADQSHLLRTLVTLIRELQQQGQIPIARVCVTCRFFQPYAHPGRPRPHHCGFVDAPFGDSGLQTDCPDHNPATPDEQATRWQRFTATRP